MGVTFSKKREMGATVPAEEDQGLSDWVPDFAFAFNDHNFSDRILRIEILSDSPTGDGSGKSTFADWASNRKRCGDPEVVGKEEERGLRLLLDTEEDEAIVTAYHDLDSEVAMVAEYQSHPAAAAPTGVFRVRNIHISSPILAARSPFFYKLFSNGMKESEQREVTLRIHASEEAAFLDLLKFMYTGTLSMSSSTSLLDVLVAADKFEVPLCMRECSRLLRELPMTSEAALLYLNLLMGEAAQPLIDAAKQFLATHYRDIEKFPEEVVNLPLVGLEAVFSTDNLLVASEDVVYDMVLKWARVHYPILEDRQKIIASRLHRLIRFPFMTHQRLIKVFTCNDFGHELAATVVFKALLFKADRPLKQQSLAEEEAKTMYRHYFVERDYRFQPVKVVEFELPRQQCIVYLDLKREKLEHLFPSGRVYSETFHLGGQGFFLSAHCVMDQQSSFHFFGLYLWMQENGSASFSVDFEYAARQKPSDDFVVSKPRSNCTFTGGKSLGYRNLFNVPWTAFIAEESAYFINGILHLRAVLTIKK